MRTSPVRDGGLWKAGAGTRGRGPGGGGGQGTVLEVRPNAQHRADKPGARRLCVFIADLQETPPIPCRSAAPPLAVPRAQQRRALGPRGERREQEEGEAAAREAGGPVPFVRWGWKTFFLITSPSRSSRVARRAGLVRLLRAGPPIFFLCNGQSWIPGLGYRSEGEQRKRRTCLRTGDPEADFSTGLESTAFSPTFNSGGLQSGSGGVEGAPASESWRPRVGRSTYWARVLWVVRRALS